MNTVVLADFENLADYREIKGSQAFETLEMHRQALKEAKKQMEQQGYKVAIETCDKAGYYKFLVMSGAVNSPQNVAAYVAEKHIGGEHIPQPDLKHQNITIIRD